MRVSLVILALGLAAPAAFAAGPEVNVGCQVSVGNQQVYSAPQFAHQPYVFSFQGKDASGAVRTFQMGVSFDGGRFSVQLIDDNHQIDDGGYLRSTMLASANVSLVAPNELSLSWGDSASANPVIQVVCTLTAGQ